MRKYNIIIVVICLFSLYAMAQEAPVADMGDMQTINVKEEPVQLPYPAILEDMTNATIHQDSLITLLMQEKISGIERGQTEIMGWRVQIYSSNNQVDAKSGALAIQQQLSGQLSVAMYVIYTPPFWKVRIGDFKTMEEALEYKKIFVENYPELQANTYIVRDEHVQLKK